MNRFSLSGKVILVTGASSGIGRACAIQIDEAGGSLILTGRNIEKLLETKNLLRANRHYTFVQDLTQCSLIELNIAAAVKTIGKLDGFVHAAGIEKSIPLRQMTPEIYNNIFGINVIAGFELARIISQNKFLSDTGASFIFISSIMGVLGKPGIVGYCSSKSALIAGAKALALELAAKRIRVNNVLPGVIDGTAMTSNLFRIIPEEAQREIVRMHPLGLGRPDDISLACVYLLSDAARWITGADIIIDGGYSAH